MNLAIAVVNNDGDVVRKKILNANFDSTFVNDIKNADDISQEGLKIQLTSVLKQLIDNELTSDLLWDLIKKED